MSATAFVVSVGGAHIRALPTFTKILRVCMLPYARFETRLTLIEDGSEQQLLVPYSAASELLTADAHSKCQVTRVQAAGPGGAILVAAFIAGRLAAAARSPLQKVVVFVSDRASQEELLRLGVEAVYPEAIEEHSAWWRAREQALLHNLDTLLLPPPAVPPEDAPALLVAQQEEPAKAQAETTPFADLLGTPAFFLEPPPGLPPLAPEPSPEPTLAQALSTVAPAPAPEPPPVAAPSLVAPALAQEPPPEAAQAPELPPAQEPPPAQAPEAPVAPPPSLAEEPAPLIDFDGDGAQEESEEDEEEDSRKVERKKPQRARVRVFARRLR